MLWFGPTQRTKVGNTVLSCCLLFIATLFESDIAESWGTAVRLEAAVSFCWEKWFCGLLMSER